ncbi:MAG: PAC2 family protein [Promethearchaeota archaeon]
MNCSNGIFVRRLVKNFKLDKPILLMGLPGMGMVGKMTVAYLIEELLAEEVIRIYSSYFPAISFLDKGGLGRLTRCELYAANDTKPNFLLFTGDCQPLSCGMVQVMSTVLDIAQENNVDTVITIGGLRSQNGPDVAAFVFSEEDATFLEQHEVEMLSSGQVTGAVGVMTALAAERDIKAFGLLGRLYSDAPVDPAAAQNVLKRLIKLYKGLETSLDLDKFVDMIEEAQEKEIIREKLVESIREKTGEEERSSCYFI